MTETTEGEYQKGYDADGEVTRSHYSALTLHRKCPQAWYYRYGLRLRRDRTDAAPEREFGSWWNALTAAETLERGRRIGSLVGAPRKLGSVDGGPEFDMATVTVADVREAAEEWWRGRGDVAREAFVETIGAPLVGRMDDAFEAWMDEHAAARRRERPLAVELFWERELPRPAGDAAWDAGHGEQPRIILIGFLDEVYEDTDRGLVVARDKKSQKQLGGASAVDDMMDSQLHLYAWGGTPTLKALGVPGIRAVAYDRVRSLAPTSPVLTASGALSKSVTQFDLRTYLSWAQTDTMSPAVADLLERDSEKWEALTDEQRDVIRSLEPGRLWGKLGDFLVSGPRKGQPKFGVYSPEEAVIEKLTTPSWRSAFHQRTLVPVSTNIVRSHLRAAVDSATDIWRTEQRSERTGEAQRNLVRMGCRFCDYDSLCRAQMFGGAEGEYDLAEHGLVGPGSSRVLSLTPKTA